MEKSLVSFGEKLYSRLFVDDLTGRFVKNHEVTTLQQVTYSCSLTHPVAGGLSNVTLSYFVST